MALISYLGVTVINLIGTDLPTTSLLASIGCLLVIFTLQLRHSGTGARRAPTWQRSMTLGAQALLTYLPIVVYHSQWGAMAGFLAGSLLLLLPKRWAWPAFGLVGLSMLIPPTVEGLSIQETIYLAQSTLLTGLVVYGLSRLAALVQALHDTRSTLASLAVAKERLRFARDLHDLLGYSLSAITLKGELIHRLIPANPRRAMEEVSEVLTISRQSLADVRLVSSGLRSMSLEQEMRSAQSLLEAADVRVHVEIRLGTLDQHVDSVLAAVLREAVTNLLRHSRASTCTMTATQYDDRVRLSVSNDGADPSYRDPSPHSGSGLGNLRARLLSTSGVLTIAYRPGDTFELVADAPARPLRRLADPDDAGFGAQDPAGRTLHHDDPHPAGRRHEHGARRPGRPAEPGGRPGGRVRGRAR
ncbi:sensor histidine kinase [Streptomyces sp. NPDC007983]|uniref:sensor histidine kinase n=1 Tax=Streptomyces sp. NPDC007983 TaxID=3364800 RepID=UPI0036E9A503